MTTARARRLPKQWQEIAHVFVLLAGWLLFIGLWWEVLQGSWDTGRFWWIVIGSMLVIPTVTVVWIFHNVSIYRQLGPRKALRAVTETYAADFNGRRVDADWGALCNARFVTISNDESRKRFRAVPPRAERRGAHWCIPALLTVPPRGTERPFGAAVRGAHESTPGLSQVDSSPSGGLARSGRSGGAVNPALASREARQALMPSRPTQVGLEPRPSLPPGDRPKGSSPGRSEDGCAPATGGGRGAPRPGADMQADVMTASR